MTPVFVVWIFFAILDGRIYEFSYADRESCVAARTALSVNSMIRPKECVQVKKVAS